MKIVVSNSQVAHLWANQSQEHAHSDSMSFRGRNLYSYSTCIAALHVSPVDGQQIALLNSRKYSTTTSTKHMPAVRNAIAGKGAMRAYCVPEVHSAFDDARNQQRMHSINISYLQAEYRAYAARLMRAQSLGPWGHDHLTQLADDATAYAAAFDLPLTAPIPNSREDWTNAQARQTRLANDPKRMARIAARDRLRIAREQREAAARVIRQQEQLLAFRNGTIGAHGYYLSDVDGAAYLRVNATADTVQTSRGATVPVADAVRAIGFIAAVRARGIAWQRNGERCPVGAFQVDSIAPNGDIHAGCHFIKWSEMAGIAAALGIADWACFAA